MELVDSTTALIRKILGTDREPPVPETPLVDLESLSQAPRGGYTFQNETAPSFRMPVIAPAPQRTQITLPQPVGAAPPATLPAPAATPRRAQPMGTIPPSLPAVASQTMASQSVKAPSLVDRYSQALDKLKTMDTSGRLTPEQKQRAELSFWLNMLARASQPGATALGSFGQAGLQTVGELSAQEKENKRAAMDMLKSHKEDVYRLAQLADKEGDNERASDQLKAQVAHWERIDKAQATHYANEARKLDKENWFALATPRGYYMVDRSGKNSPYVLSDKNGVPLKPEAKSERAPNATESAVAQMRKAGLTEKEIADRLHPPLNEGDMTPAKQVERALALQVPDVMGKRPSPAEAWQRVAETVAASKGQVPSGGLPRFNSLAEAREAKRTGKIKAGDTIMTPNGPIVVQ